MFPNHIAKVNQTDPRQVVHNMEMIETRKREREGPQDPKNARASHG